MTAPVPAPRLSPTAGVFNAIVRHLNTCLTARIAELRLLIAAETETGHAAATALAHPGVGVVTAQVLLPG